MNNQQPTGYEWLKKHFDLSYFILTHASFIGNNSAVELTSKGNVEQTYGPKYRVSENTPLHHLEFGLKYDDLNLDFLKAVFEKIPQKDIEEFINSSPASKYARKIGFLYELLSDNLLNLSKPVSGNYTNLLDEEKYVTGKTKKESRWRINNNLLGTKAYCPVVRKTKELKELLDLNIQEEIKRLEGNFSPDVFRRAIRYLYNKETRSSYEIEREKPSADRMEKFVALLTKAGTETNEALVSAKRLLILQNAIVDFRFAATQIRNFQNFVGESLPNYQEQIHYVCPPPAILPSLMHGLWLTTLKTEGTPPEIRSALISFGFVFIHPFEDGNGRIHRFLIHDVLAHDKLVPQGLIIPVSAHMLNHIREYDHILEKYSKPLMQRVSYTRNEDGSIVVTNISALTGYYRYPDLTDHCIYLIKTLHATLREDMPDELLFMQRYDEAKRELQRIVDMPDKDINLMLNFLHQNAGTFPKRRREHFKKLTDEEITQMQVAYREVFELDKAM